MEFRSHFAYDTKAASDEAANAACPDGPGESLTVQSQADDADINVMLRRFGVLSNMELTPAVVAMLPHGRVLPEYGDFTGVKDYQSALQVVEDAERQFLAMPAEVRARFDNDPQRLLEFASVPENIPELVKMGLGKEILNVGVGEGAAGAASAEAGKAA